MAELIQFSCPVCGATLRLPLAMAGEHGPCPRCGRDIVAPDPHRGVGGRVHFPAPPAAMRQPLQPFAAMPDQPVLREQAPLMARISEPASPRLAGEPEPVPDVPVPRSSVPRHDPPRGSNAAVLVLSVLLTGVVCLVAGYLLGIRSDWLVSRTPYPVMPPLELMDDRNDELPKPVLVKPAIPPAPEAPAAAPPPPAEVPASDPPPPAPVDSTKASALAEASLKAFLAAPDWAARSAYVLKPETVRAAMEAYSKQQPDGPTLPRSITVENSHTDKQTGYTLFIFKLVTELHPSGFPVAVAETDAGWLVDWESFVEFRDDHFRSFADGPAERSGRFHVVVRQPPAERAASTENGHFSSFLLDPPLPGRQRIAYARKGTETHARLLAATADGGLFWPVLDVAKRKAPDGRTFLEITGLVADNWLPETR